WIVEMDEIEGAKARQQLGKQWGIPDPYEWREPVYRRRPYLLDGGGAAHSRRKHLDVMAQACKLQGMVVAYIARPSFIRRESSRDMGDFHLILVLQVCRTAAYLPPGRSLSSFIHRTVSLTPCRS